MFDKARESGSLSHRYSLNRLYSAGVGMIQYPVLSCISWRSSIAMFQYARQQPKVFAKITFCSSVGYALYFIAVFASGIISRFVFCVVFNIIISLDEKQK